MDDKQLERSLRSVGMGCFVKYFREFSDHRLAREDIIELLMKNEGYKESGCKTRVSQSRRIIGIGRAVDALKMVSESERVPPHVVDEARRLMREF